MKKWLFVATVVVMATFSSWVHAGIFFHRHPKPATEEVPALIQSVKTDPDEHKRALAAEMLRDFDPAANPDVIPVLIDVLQHDTKTAVRLEALQSLGKFRPVSSSVGQVIEEAAEHDPSFRVRLQAKSSLVHYHLSGYRSPKKESPRAAPNSTGEPPLADPTARSNIRPRTAPRFVTNSSPPSIDSPTVSRGTTSPLVPAQPPKFEMPPALPSDGPELPPPQ